MKLTVNEKIQRKISTEEAPLIWPVAMTNLITFWIQQARPFLKMLNKFPFTNFWINSLGSPLSDLLTKLKKTTKILIGKELTFLESRHVYATHTSLKAKTIKDPQERQEIINNQTSYANHSTEIFLKYYNDDLGEKN